MDAAPNPQIASTRRLFLGRSATGLGALGLASLLKPDLLASAPAAAPVPHFKSKAKRIIYFF